MIEYWFFKIAFVHNVSSYACVCLLLSLFLFVITVYNPIKYNHIVV